MWGWGGVLLLLKQMDMSIELNKMAFEIFGIHPAILLSLGIKAI